MKKRTKRLEIALSEEEYAALHARKTKARLAEWVREVALAQQPIHKPQPIDPRLLYELNRIGTNLNQIARSLNLDKLLGSPIDVVKIATLLHSIDTELKAVCRDR